MQGRAGFTFIELLIVVVILGILAAIAAPRYVNTKGKAYVAQMKTDLRNLAAAEEAFQGEYSAFYGGTIPGPGLIYEPTAGVVITLSNVSANGWAALATYPSGTAQTCALFLGTAAAVAPATVEGEVACN